MLHTVSKTKTFIKNDSKNLPARCSIQHATPLNQLKECRPGSEHDVEAGCVVYALLQSQSNRDTTRAPACASRHNTCNKHCSAYCHHWLFRSVARDLTGAIAYNLHQPTGDHYRRIKKIYSSCFVQRSSQTLLSPNFRRASAYYRCSGRISAENISGSRYKLWDQCNTCTIHPAHPLALTFSGTDHFLGLNARSFLSQRQRGQQQNNIASWICSGVCMI